MLTTFSEYWKWEVACAFIRVDDRRQLYGSQRVKGNGIKQFKYLEYVVLLQQSEDEEKKEYSEPVQKAFLLT